MSEIHDNWKQQLKDNGFKYFVLKAENLIDCLNEVDLLLFNDILNQYNEFRKPKPINSYFIINRDDCEFNSINEFLENNLKNETK